VAAFNGRIARVQNLLDRETRHHRSFSLAPSSPAPACSSNYN
jgi:hypothetical protein